MMQVSPTPPAGVPVWQRHWPMLLTGIGLAAMAVLLSYLGGGALPLARILLLGGGLILAGQAIVLRLREWHEEGEGRVESAAVIVLAGFTALLGLFAIDKEWDSADLILKAMLVVAGIGAALVLLPSRQRRAALVFFVLFHFAGILVVVTQIPPPGSNQPAPFIPSQAWIHVYRHYLGFLSMNNAYHFYSPEPGPPTLLWFQLNYLKDGEHYQLTDDRLASLGAAIRKSGDDESSWRILKAKLVPLEKKSFADREDFLKELKGILTKEESERYQEAILDNAWNVTSEWFRIPNRADSPVNLHYQRLLSVTESCNTIVNPVSDAVLQSISPRRRTAGRIHDIPTYPGESLAAQFQPPTDFSGLLIQAAVRRVALLHEHSAKDPTAKLVSIKFYRVRHKIIPTAALAGGFSPLDKSLYLPYYMGEYLPNGQIVNFSADPYLYWLLPIYFDGREMRDYQEKHAAMVYNRASIEKSAMKATPEEAKP